MSPEQCTDSRDVKPQADVYSLGCTLYKLLCGEAPYSGEQYGGVREQVDAIMKDKPPPLRQRRADVLAALAKIVSRMLIKDPDAHYDSAAKALQNPVHGTRAAESCRNWGESQIAAHQKTLGNSKGCE